MCIKYASLEQRQHHSNALVRLSDRIARLEAGGGGDIITLKAIVSALKGEVEQLKFTNLNFLLMDPVMGYALAEIVIPTTPLTAAPLVVEGQHERMNEYSDNEDDETNEELFVKRLLQVVIYFLQDLENVMVIVITEVSHGETSMVDTSGTT
ncbi:hypothetical protein HAX54_025418 [Datura stramonium]|uniref:Uncharacterized protein n=1 Tax=Datura stramonium TaxID=4076 RepID=A0ABS8Y6T5_DATST|nr:hypothetical protein [Datura stramonium]